MDADGDDDAEGSSRLPMRKTTLRRTVISGSVPIALISVSYMVRGVLTFKGRPEHVPTSDVI